MGLFDTEDVFLKKIRTENRARSRGEENIFRLLGGAMRTWNEKNDPSVVRAREVQSIVKEAGFSPDGLAKTAQKLNQLGYTEEAHQAVSRALEMKKSMQPAKRGMHKDALGYQRYSDTNERVHPDLVKPTATAGSFREEVVDSEGRLRKGLFNQKGELITYLGEGKEQKSEMTGLTPRTFLLPNGTYRSGSYDKNTGRRYLIKRGLLTEAPEGTVDVSYRVQKEPKLSDKATDQLIKKSGTLDSYLNLLDGFKEDFGGYKLEVVGDVVNSMKKKFGDESGQALWWQQHDILKNKLRHELFGSALTKVEKENFDKITIDPGQHPSVIKANLAAQFNIAKSAAQKLIGVQKAKGIPNSQVRSAVGETVWTLVYPEDAENVTTRWIKGEDGTWRSE